MSAINKMCSNPALATRRQQIFLSCSLYIWHPCFLCVTGIHLQDLRHSNHLPTSTLSPVQYPSAGNPPRLFNILSVDRTHHYQANTPCCQPPSTNPVGHPTSISPAFLSNKTDPLAVPQQPGQRSCIPSPPPPSESLVYCSSRSWLLPCRCISPSHLHRA